MKKLYVLFVLAFVAMLSVGCSEMSNPIVSVEPDSETASAQILFTIQPPAGLAKTASSWDAPDYIVAGGWQGYGKRDTIDIPEGSTSVLANLTGFVRGQTYDLHFAAYRYGDVSGIYGYSPQYNVGTLRVTVPDSSSFSRSVNLVTTSHKFRASVPIKGTPVAGTADSVYVKAYSPFEGGSSVIYEFKKGFAVGSVDTARFQQMLLLSSIRQTTSYVITVSIFNVDGSFYSGSANIEITPGVNTAPLVVPLVLFGGTNSIAKLSISIGGYGETVATVSFP